MSETKRITMDDVASGVPREAAIDPENFDAYAAGPVPAETAEARLLKLCIYYQVKARDWREIANAAQDGGYAASANGTAAEAQGKADAIAAVLDRLEAAEQRNTSLKFDLDMFAAVLGVTSRDGVEAAVNNLNARIGTLESALADARRERDEERLKRDVLKTERDTLRAQLVEAEKERDVERSRFASWAETLRTLAVDMDRQPSEWGHFRHRVFGTLTSAASQFIQYANGQPSPSNYRRRAEQAQADLAVARETIAALTARVQELEGRIANALL